MTDTLLTKDGQPIEQQEWTYIGERLDSKGVLSHVWLDQSNKERWFVNALTTRPAIGSVYRVSLHTSGSGVYVNGELAPVFVAHKDATSPLAKWKAEHDAAKTRVQVRKELKKLPRNMGAMTLDEASDWYRSVNRSLTRSAKLAIIITYVQKGSVPEEEG